MVGTINQFDVCPNLGANKAAVPLLLVIQHDVARLFETRIVVPLVDATSRRLLERADPVVTINNKRYAAVFAQMRALPLTDLGVPITSLKEHHVNFMHACDFLFSGY